jgi:regulator of protease activity HflC (stomatin/prohibitin superfamily)
VGQLLQLVLDNLYSLWPIRIIDKGSQGVLWKHDGTARTLQPGTHFLIPKLWRIEEVDVQYQNIDTGTQGLTTKDGVAVSLSMNVGYSIADSAKLYTSFQHWDTSLVNKARGYLAEEVPLKTWNQLYKNPADVAATVLDRLQEDVGEENGCVLIEDVTVDQAVKSDAYRLFTTGNLF